MLRIHLLGEFAVEHCGVRLPHSAWRSSRASGLVKLLALTERRRLHREICCDLFWPDLSPYAAANNFNVAVTRARKALSTTVDKPDRFLFRDGDIVALAGTDLVWVDVDAFRTAVETAWRTERLADFRTAAEMYGGELLVEDRYEEWTLAARISLTSSYLEVLSRLVHLESAAGNTEAAIDICYQILDRDPLHEATVIDLMRLLDQTGQRARALDEFRRLDTGIRLALDLEPSPAVTDLARRIRTGSIHRASPNCQSRPKSTLPKPIAGLIGRERECADIAVLLASSRLVTLSGPGGVGKTRLAIAVASKLEPSFADGSVFIDLSSHESAASAAASIAESLGLTTVAESSPIDSIASRLAARKLLLVLDNLEQVQNISSVLQQVLERTAHLRLLVTSRARLNLSSEQVYSVSPLTLPRHDLDREAASVELFARRARSVDSSFQIDMTNLPDITAVCRRVDGLPLALELAAARSNILSPASMLKRLDQPLELLAAGPADLPARQQTMRNTIAWSHALLSQAEQAVLHRLAIFAGGWTLEAAEAVLGDMQGGATAIDSLNDLVNKHLVEIRDVPPGKRFFQLVSIRSFCLEQLEVSSDWTKVRHRHARWCLDFAETASQHWESEDQAEWLDRTATEEANLRIALDWFISAGDAGAAVRLVISLQMYWFIRGRVAEGQERTQQVLGMACPESMLPLRIDALNGLGMLLRDGDIQGATRIGRESLSLATRLGDPKREADALANLGFLALNRSDRDEAATLFSRSLAINEEIGNEQGIADSLSFLALTAFHDGRLAHSIELNERSLRLWQALDDHQGVVWAKVKLAATLACNGELERAHGELSSAYRLAQALDFRWGLSWALNGMAILAMEIGALGAARTFCIRAYQIRKESGLRPGPLEREAIDRQHHDLGMDRDTSSAHISEDDLARAVSALCADPLLNGNRVLSQQI